MNDQHHRFAFADHFDNDLYSGTRMRDRVLNAAIIRADISGSYEEYLEIFDEFYADDVEASDERRDEPIRGKAQVRSLLMSFLVPLHVMAEVGGLSIFIREAPVSGDVAGETNSAWTLDLVAASGAICTLSWYAFRRWNSSQVVFEHHYNVVQTGRPLTLDDFRFTLVDPEEFRLLS
jgi:hypothetical protein